MVGILAMTMVAPIAPTVGGMLALKEYHAERQSLYRVTVEKHQSQLYSFHTFMNTNITTVEIADLTFGTMTFIKQVQSDARQCRPTPPAHTADFHIARILPSTANGMLNAMYGTITAQRVLLMCRSLTRTASGIMIHWAAGTCRSWYSYAGVAPLESQRRYCVGKHGEITTTTAMTTSVTLRLFMKCVGTLNVVTP